MDLKDAIELVRPVKPLRICPEPLPHWAHDPDFGRKLDEREWENFLARLTGKDRQ